MDLRTAGKFELIIALFIHIIIATMKKKTIKIDKKKQNNK